MADRVKVKMANPGPAALMVINPKRSKSMATRKRRKTTIRRRSTARRRTSNPTATQSRSRRRATAYSSSRRRRPVQHRRHVRRNPAGGLLKNAVGLAAGITAVGLLQGFVPPIGGASVFAIAGRQAAIGWLAGEGMKRFGVFRGYADDVKLAGFALGVGTLINAYLMPTISGFLRPAPKQTGSGMQGIAVVPAIPPSLAIAPPVNNGVNGIGVYSTPGAAFRRAR